VNYIHGMHEHCPLDVMPDGTVLYIAEVGDSTVPHSGIDLSGEPRRVMIRIQWLFGVDGGCYPPPALQPGFIQRVESLVRNTPGCHIWQGGNEPNIETEGLFSPEYAAEMYGAIRDAVHAQPGHGADVVLLPPIGPWNVEIGYGWIDYFERVIAACPDIDGFALHTYSRGSAASSIYSEDRMDAPYGHLHNGFRTYRDWMAVIPERYRDLPCYITETDQNDAWSTEVSTWVQCAYKEIDDWNQTPGNQQIRALILYRWPPYDKYAIEGNQRVIDDFKLAQTHGYEWTEEAPPMAEWAMIYAESMNGGFYPYNGEGPLTVPFFSVPLWEHDPSGQGALYRPEYATRAEPHVHSAPNAAGMFSMYSTMEGAIVFEIPVKPGDEVRASVWGMGVDGKDSQMSLRAGIAVDNPGEGAITVQANDGKFAGVLESRANWGDWYGANVGGEWAQLWTPVDTATRDRVWIVLNARKDVRKPGHSHWDDLIVEVRDGGIEPPEPPDNPPGDGTLGDLLGTLEAALIAEDDAHQVTTSAYMAVVDYVDTAAVRALVVG